MAVDPLAGTSKPLPPRDVLESRVRQPLQFAATLVTADALATLHHELQPRIRTREIERVPGVPLAGDIPGSVNEAKDEIARLLQDVKRLNLGSTSGDAHSSARPLTFPYNTGKLDSPIQGSPEWLESRISALIFDADTSVGGDAATLDLSGLQMRVLSDKIGELQDMTRLAKRSYERRKEKGPSHPQTQLGALGKRQFKRYTSAPVTSSGNMSGGLAAQPPPFNAPMAPTPRTVSGPSQTALAYASTTERTRPLVRARSGLHRELSSTSSASSASSVPGPSYARQGMSRHSSRGSVTALGEGDSFASTTSTVFSSLSEESGTSSTTLVEEEEEGDDLAFEGRAVKKGSKRSSFPSNMDPGSSRMTPSSQRTTSSPLWHFKNTYQQPRVQTQNVRTFERSSSAMIPASTASGSSIGPTLRYTEPPSRRTLGNKTVSFAHLGVGANHSPSSSSSLYVAPASDHSVRSSQEWSRSASGTWNPVEKTTWKGSSRGDVQLILSNNMLTCLPSTLFQVTNLVVLTLRHNQLTELPGAINELKNLKELNKTLPPAILDLENLEQFTFVNTELERSPDPTKVQLYASGRKLEPLIVRRPGITSLRSTALSVLLSSRLPHNLPPILTSIDWEPSPEERGTRNAVHGLYNASTLASRVRCLTVVEARAMIAAARAAYRHSSSSRKHDDGIPNPAFSGAASSPSVGAAGSMAAGAGVEGEPSDDAAANPYFSPCPNPAHSGVFTRKLYLGEPAVERIEWTRVNGADKEVPILWKGCSAECLDFLEAAVGDDDEVLSDTDIEEGSHGVLEEDGFDADVLGGDDPF